MFRTIPSPLPRLLARRPKAFWRALQLVIDEPAIRLIDQRCTCGHWAVGHFAILDNRRCCCCSCPSFVLAR